MKTADDRDAAIAALRMLVLAAQRFTTATSVRSGLAPNDSRALAVLSIEPGLPQWELAQRLGITSGGVTYLVDRLEEAGLARRLPDPNHRRRFQLTLGDHGERLASDGAERLARAMTDVSDHQLVTFVEVAHAIARGLDDEAATLEQQADDRTDDPDAAPVATG